MSSTRSWKIPTSEEVARAVVLLGQPAQARYFFDRLNNPEWIQPLRELGVFRRPPPAGPEDEKGRRSYPLWPPSRYLARMASARPHLVRAIINEMTDTNNGVIHEDIVFAALNMPPEVAASIVPVIVERVRPHFPLLPAKLAELMVHVAAEGQEQSALLLAKLILTPIRRDTEPVHLGGELVDLGPAIEPPIPEHEYEEVLRTHFQRLVDRVGFPAIQTLGDILEQAVSKGESRGSGPQDHSEIWRPAIEDRQENIGSETKGLLVVGLRDAAVRLVHMTPTELGHVVLELEGRPWHIFRRIALHLLRTFRELPQGKTLSEERLRDRSLFDASWARNEYVQLLGAAFGQLSHGQQEEILSWIDSGPDLDAFRRFEEAWTGRIPPESDVERFRRMWQRDYLHLVAQHLQGRRAEFYRALVDELGEPAALDASSRVSSWVGPTSPATADEIRRMSGATLSEFLRRWRHRGTHFEPTPEGLGRVLAAVVKEEPKRFAVDARLFQGMDATYVRAIFRGLADAVEEGREFDWSGPFELANWALEQPRAIPGRESGSHDPDPHWGWCYQAIASLLNAGLRKDRIPREARAEVWRLLERLTHDVDPTPEEDQAEGMDPATRSINSVRGEAMHAVIAYALWHRRHAEAAGATEEVRAGFLSMPEVGRVLEERLDLAVEPSRTIRAVYGQWFPWLVLLDEEWARRWVNVIFPPADDLLPLWQAAWHTYLVFCTPYDSVFRVLRDHYRRGIEAITREHRDLGRDPDAQLAAHLMMYYTRNLIPLDDAMFSRFWELAPPRLAAHALSFIGQALSRDTEPIPEAVLGRLKALWDYRRDAIAQVGYDRAEEAAAFGWWFASNKFDPKWAIRELNTALRLAGTVRVDFKVIEQLSVLARAYPREAVDAVGMFVEGEQPWKIHGWREELRAIFVAALTSGDEATREKTRHIINRLGTRGYFDFRDLLGL